MDDELKPCPFCGPIKETLTDATRVLGVWRLIHRCKVIGPILIESSEPEMVAEVWNTRADIAEAEAANLRAKLAEARKVMVTSVFDLREYLREDSGTMLVETTIELIDATLARIAEDTP